MFSNVPHFLLSHKSNYTTHTPPKSIFHTKNLVYFLPTSEMPTCLIVISAIKSTTRYINWRVKIHTHTDRLIQQQEQVGTTVNIILCHFTADIISFTVAIVGNSC